MYTHTHTYRNAERGKRDDGNIKRMLIKEKREKRWDVCVCVYRDRKLYTNDTYPKKIL